MNEKQKSAIMSEARLMSLLAPHPNVLLFRGVTVEPFCIVTDFCDGGSLKNILSSTAEITYEQKLKWISDIAKGMAHLHNGVGDPKVILLHRDLASRNILLKSGNAVVSDFGMALARDVRTSVREETDLVPIRWMAPESLLDNLYSTKSDVFSFGVVIWEIVTRRSPWSGERMNAIARNVIKGDRLIIPDDCDVELKKLMNMCWQAEVDDRPEFTEVCDYLHQMDYQNVAEVFREEIKMEIKLSQTPVPQTYIKTPRAVLGADYGNAEDWEDGIPGSVRKVITSSDKRRSRSTSQPPVLEKELSMNNYSPMEDIHMPEDEDIKIV